MKLITIAKSMLAYLFFSIILLFIFSENSYSSECFNNAAIENIWGEEESQQDGEVGTNGSWPVEHRSLSSRPIVYLTNNYLTVYNLYYTSDITIQLTNSDGNLVYEKIITIITSPEEIISIEDFPSGIYTIDLKNSKGGHLYGDFEL